MNSYPTFSRLPMSALLAFLYFLISIPSAFSQVKSSDWRGSDNKSTIHLPSSHFNTLPQDYLTYNISVDHFIRNIDNKSNTIELPNPDGEFEDYIILPSKVVADEVAHYYTIKTFQGYKKNNPSVLISCDISTDGFHAAVYDGSHTYFIEPIHKVAKSEHIVYYKNNLKAERIKCLADHSAVEYAQQEYHHKSTNDGLKIFKLALLASGEYAQQFGGSPYNVTNVLNAMASGVNLMAPIWTRDIGVQFLIVSTPAQVYPDPTLDPFNIAAPGSLPAGCNNECLANLNAADYDIGHLVVWQNTGGAATLGNICDDANKGRGFSGVNSSVSILWVDYVSHELGHQFGSHHNFTSTCYGGATAVNRREPGEGTSIMSYAGICPATESYSSGVIPYFHFNSIDQIQSKINSRNCYTSGPAVNPSAPMADAREDIVIPKDTPFVLVGNGVDAEDTSITYSWAQNDIAPVATTGSPDCSDPASVLFRYNAPTSDSYRSFPNYTDVLSGNNLGVVWEQLPCVNRMMSFTLEIRDNNPSCGRMALDSMDVIVGNSGPFNISFPNGGEMLSGVTTINWQVNNTNLHQPTVDILLSIDNGNTYTVIANSTTNDGIEDIFLPNISTSTARILVRGDVAGGFRSASTFYDVSDNTFSIVPNGAVCPFVMNVSYPIIPSGTFKALNTINSSSILANTSTVVFQGDTEINLGPGFEVPVDASFAAKIDICN